MAFHKSQESLTFAPSFQSYLDAMGDIPLIAILFPVAMVSTLPIIAMTLLFGGWGAFFLCVASFAAIAGYLFWDFVLGGISFSTGMEGIALVILPAWWIVGSAWSGIVYSVIRLLGWLPHQR
ncbi:MAG: hypothetical protein AAF729_08605 [Pseudomonadota bacterium]